MDDNIELIDDAYINRSPEKIEGYTRCVGTLALFGLLRDNIPYWVSEHRERLLAKGAGVLPSIIFIKDLSISSVEVNYHRTRNSILVFEDDYFNVIQKGLIS